MRKEYCATVVQISTLKPIEGSDFLSETVINGCNIVVRKDEIKEGDVLIYAPIETQLNEEFLSANNLFEIGNFTLNSNSNEVSKLLLEASSLRGKHETALVEQPDTYDGGWMAKADEVMKQARDMCGYFTKTRRIKIIKLRKRPSMGFLFSKDALKKWIPEVEELNLEEHIGEDFDTVCGKLLLKVYIPYVRTSRRGGYKPSKKSDKMMEEILQGNWIQHYETQQLGKTMFRFTPQTPVFISTKVHGSLGQYGNVWIKKPKVYKNRILNFINKIIPKPFKRYKTGYEVVYGSHRVVKNKDINEAANNGGFYGTDIWEKYYKLLSPYLDEGMVVYGEICGYAEGTKGIQGNYDYGCKTGENKFMPYRIYVADKEGNRKEWELDEVQEWTMQMASSHEELAHNLMPIDIMYQGTLGDLYADIPRDDKWQDNVLEALSNDKRFFMEEKEPLCKNKVNREGICIRIIGDPVAECFKLKCKKFLFDEAESITKGNIDMEMAENYDV